MRILLVDDSKLQLWALRKILTKAGYDITEAADGEQGLKQARTSAPDLILLDMILPRMDGLTVLATLKKDPQTADIPVIVLTSLSQKNEAMLKNAGAAAFYQKSELGIEQGAEALLELVREVLSESKRSKAAGVPSR